MPIKFMSQSFSILRLACLLSRYRGASPASGARRQVYPIAQAGPRGSRDGLAGIGGHAALLNTEAILLK